MLCVALAGCGVKTGAAARTTTSRPTKAAYIAKADAISKVANAKIETLIPLNFFSASPGPYARKLEASVGVQRTALAALRELPKPPGDKPTLAAIWSAQSKLIQAQAQSV